MEMDHVIGRLSQALSTLGGLGAEHTKVDVVIEGKIAIEIARVASENGIRKGEETLFIYNGIKYEKLSSNNVYDLICGLLEELEIGIPYQMKSIESIFKRIYRSRKMKSFEPSKSIISFNNCVLTLNDMKSHEHGPEWMTRTHIPHGYDPKAKCPEWRKFLTEVISDEDSIKVLQEFFGLMFIDRADMKVAVAMFLYGTGANGKTVLGDTINYVIGQENYTNFSFPQLCTTNDANYNTAVANGKLLNNVSDMGDKDFSGGQFKAITSYDPIMARPIGMAPFTAREMPLMMASINKVPVTTDSTNGNWRRYKIVRFEKTFEGKSADGYVELKLRTEASGILNWIMEGRERLVKSHGQFTESEKMEDANRKMRQHSSSVLSFLEEKGWVGRLKPGQAGHRDCMHSVDLFSNYVEYCTSWRNTPKSKNNFFDDIRQENFTYEPTLRIFGKKSTGWSFYKIDFNDGDEIGEPEKETGLGVFTEEEQELPF